MSSFEGNNALKHNLINCEKNYAHKIANFC